MNIPPNCSTKFWEVFGIYTHISPPPPPPPDELTSKGPVRGISQTNIMVPSLSLFSNQKDLL